MPRPGADRERSGVGAGSPAGRCGPGGRQAELARVEDATGVEGGLGRGQDVEGGPERLGDVAAPVEPHPVVMAERAALRQDGALAGVPQVAVVRITPVRVDLATTSISEGSGRVTPAAARMVPRSEPGFDVTSATPLTSSP